jgi:putative hydrolase of the HAD superfamily
VNHAIRCVLFDLDGVLADYDRDIRIDTLARLIHRSSVAVRAAIYESGIEDAADAGTLSANAYLDALSGELGVIVNTDDWTTARRAATCVRSDGLVLAESIASRGITVGLLTNNGWLMAQALPVIVPALFPLFAGRAFCAAQFGAAKPDAEAYIGCVKALGASPHATLFIDDNAANVQGARTAGLSAHQFIDMPDLSRALARWGLR